MRNAVSDGLLYNPADEHDACGVGFVANVSGRASHDIVETALEALSNLTHRGAIDADGRTGDGAGVLTQLPARFFRREAERLGQRAEDELAIGMFFLPRDNRARLRCKTITQREIEKHGLDLLGWRPVPVDESVLGSKAQSSAPVIEQLLVARGLVPKSRLESVLYQVRREIEERASDIDDFYVPS